MLDRSDVIYVYDGTFEGLMTCVFQSYAEHRKPSEIVDEKDFEDSFFESRHIATDLKKSDRVERGIINTASEEAYEIVYKSFLTCLESKEMRILDYVELALSEGKRVESLLGDPRVNTLDKAVRALDRECHHYKGFVRFSVHSNALTAVIEPKNFVLPGLIAHFQNRYRNESYMIYDKTHGWALFGGMREPTIIPVDDYMEPSPDDDEINYRAMWKMFYDEIAISQRTNPRCRMSFMPKRFWSRLTEMQENDRRPDGAGNYSTDGSQQEEDCSTALFLRGRI